MDGFSVEFIRTDFLILWILFLHRSMILETDLSTSEDRAACVRREMSSVFVSKILPGRDKSLRSQRLNLPCDWVKVQSTPTVLVFVDNNTWLSLLLGRWKYKKQSIVWGWAAHLCWCLSEVQKQQRKCWLYGHLRGLFLKIVSCHRPVGWCSFLCQLH